MEQRTKYLSFDAEFRSEGEGEDRKIVGYAAVFGKLSEDLGGFRERIKRGAFKRALSEGADVLALHEHDRRHILGRTTSGTLKLKEDREGLAVEIVPPDTQTGRDVMESLRRRDLRQMSFAFIPIDTADVTEGGERIRELRDVDLLDVSIVAQPAYLQTIAKLRAKELAADLEEAEREAESRRRQLRLAGVGGR